MGKSVPNMVWSTPKCSILFLGLLWGDSEQGAGGVDVHVGAGKLPAGVLPLTVASQVGGDAGEIRDFLNDIHQPAGRGEIRAAVPGVEQDGQPPAVGFLIDGEHLRVVDIELLEIRVELNAPQPPALDIVHLRLNIGHVLVPGSQAGELGVLSGTCPQ